MNLSLEQYLKTRYTQETTAAYLREIENYTRSFKGAESAVYKDILNYIGTLRKRYRNGRTLNRILAGIKAYYDFLNFSGKRKDNPAKSIRLRDKQNRDIQLQDLFTNEELETLQQRPERFNLLNHRNHVLISLLIYQALRPGELEALTINDINLQQGTVYIRSTPKTNARTLELRTNQILLFYQYIHEIRPKLVKEKQTENLLIGQRGEPMKSTDITKHVKRSYGKRFPGRKVNVMTIRQSVITNLLKAGNDLRSVQMFAGHKHPGTTEKYKQSNVDELKTAVQKYHPIR